MCVFVCVRFLMYATVLSNITPLSCFQKIVLCVAGIYMYIHVCVCMCVCVYVCVCVCVCVCVTRSQQETK